MDNESISVRLDHTIIPAHDKHAAAKFFTEIFGLAAPKNAGHFVQVRLSNGCDLDFDEPGTDFPGHHYAFLVDDKTFDGVIARIRERHLDHWADPGRRRPGEINTHRGGRGVYFHDPSGHFLEALTVRYDGSSLA